MAQLQARGRSCVRINDGDAVVELELTISATGCDAWLSFASGARVQLSAVESCWHRCGGLKWRLPDDAPPGLRALLAAEWQAVETALWARLAAGPGLGLGFGLGLHRGDCPNLVQLIAAQAQGLDLPQTLVTSSKEALAAFLQQHGRVITKRIESPPIFTMDGGTYSAGGTRLLEASELQALAPRFFPALVQAYVDKAYELRVFYLAGTFHAMALLPTTAAPGLPTDIRSVDYRSHLRLVPYVLPPAIAQKLEALMRHLGLDNGSIDLIVTPDDRFVFIEINPSGQLDWLAKECNYPIPEKLADLLCQPQNDASGRDHQP